MMAGEERARPKQEANLKCEACGTTFYSAAASTMVANGERCDCGGELVLVDPVQSFMRGCAQHRRTARRDPRRDR